MKTKISPERLLSNHLTFLAAHRGEVIIKECCLAIHSDKPEFTYAILRGDCALDHIKHTYNIIHLLPSAMKQEQSLLESGYKNSHDLSYMILDGATDSWRTLTGLECRRGTVKEDIAEFSHVQAAGFAESEKDYESWHPWLSSANQRNRGSANQAFYIGYLDGNPIGVCLLVLADGVAGIYAVATLAEYRKRGISATIMKRAIADARQLGCRTITLQVVKNSYAETFYKKLGFDEQFTARIYKRKESSSIM